MTQTFNDKLQNLADLAVKIGVGLQPGQRLLIRAPIESAPLVRRVTEAAYKAGARLVDVVWADDALTLLRFQHAPRDSFEEYPDWHVAALMDIAGRHDATLSVMATDPDLLKGQDPDLVALTERVHRTRTLPFAEKVMNDELNWSIVSHPLESWAAKVFPTLPDDLREPKLWDAIFQTCRADQPDPVAAWEAHLARLAERRDWLNAKQYTALHYQAPGTDFRLGLPQNHLWHGGRKETLDGIPYIPNMPTEEVFTMPHREQAEGVVTSSKPLSYAGVLIENFTLRFEQGRVVNFSAEKGEAALRKLVEMDEGSARLGEVALVPHSNPISQSGVLFYNTLFDENAASHVALGRAYRFCLEDGPHMSADEFSAAGGNNSLAHVDFMIGSAAMDIDGVRADGSVEPVMRAGEWAV